MSRRKIPSRTAAFLALAAAAFAWTSAADVAGAQQRPEDRDREASARTIIGAPNASRCAQAAAAGDVSDEAVEFCDRALQRERLNRANEIATHINRGALHMRRRDGEAALIDFDAVIALEPDNAEAHLNRGAALVMVGRPGPAVAAITTALTLGVAEPHKAYFNRAAAREALGDVRGAYEDYSTALAIEPDWGAANAELARFARIRRDRLAEVVAEGDEGDEGVGAEGAATPEPGATP